MPSKVARHATSKTKIKEPWHSLIEAALLLVRWNFTSGNLVLLHTALIRSYLTIVARWLASGPPRSGHGLQTREYQAVYFISTGSSPFA